MNLAADEALLVEVYDRLRARFGASVTLVQRKEGWIVLQIGAADDATIGIEVDDSSRPNFRVSYPRLRVKRDGSRRVQTATVDGVFFEGIRWIAAQLHKNGAVFPEFMSG